MRDAESYIPHFQLNQPMNGYGVAEVIESKNSAFPKGALVSGMTGWQQYSVIPEAFAKQLRVLPENARTSKRIPLSAWVGVLGMPVSLVDFFLSWFGLVWFGLVWMSIA